MLFGVVFQVNDQNAKTEGEAQEKGIKEVFKKMELLDENLKSFYLDGTSSTDTEHLGLLDVVFVTLFGNYKVHEEVLGIKVIDPEKTPLLHSWLRALLDLPLVKEILSSREKMAAFLKVH